MTGIALVAGGAGLPAGGRHRRWVGFGAAVVAILALLTGCGSPPAGSVGSEAVGSLAATTPGPVPSVAVAAGTLPAAAAAIAPTRLRIAVIGVTAAVAPVGIDARTGEFAVPPSVDVVGWYRHGPGLEATAGSIVIAGHVDSSSQGKGAFFRLRQLDRGDAVEVTGADGAVHRFAVIAREEWKKVAIPLDTYFDRSGKVRLTLITCGGPFDQTTRSYRDNIVITAVPV